MFILQFVICCLQAAQCACGVVFEGDRCLLTCFDLLMDIGKQAALQHGGTAEPATPRAQSTDQAPVQALPYSEHAAVATRSVQLHQRF
jgi:hypothetical protein